MGRLLLEQNNGTGILLHLRVGLGPVLDAGQLAAQVQHAEIVGRLRQSQVSGRLHRVKVRIALCQRVVQAFGQQPLGVGHEHVVQQQLAEQPAQAARWHALMADDGLESAAKAIMTIIGESPAPLDAAELLEGRIKVEHAHWWTGDFRMMPPPEVLTLGLANVPPGRVWGCGGYQTSYDFEEEDE